MIPWPATSPPETKKSIGSKVENWRAGVSARQYFDERAHWRARRPGTEARPPVVVLRLAIGIFTQYHGSDLTFKFVLTKIQPFVGKTLLSYASAVRNQSVSHGIADR